MLPLPLPNLVTGRGVIVMSDILAALFVTVVGGIIVHYAVKWIDSWLDER